MRAIWSTTLEPGDGSLAPRRPHQLRDVPVTDRATWAHVARESSGAFAGWSQLVEVTPGPLAQTSRELARSAHLRSHQSKAKPTQLGSAAGAAMILMQAASGGQGTMAEAIMLRHLGRPTVAVLDAHATVGDARRAEQLTAMMHEKFAQIEQQMPQIPSTQNGLLDVNAGTRTVTSENETMRRGTDVLAAPGTGPPLPTTLRPGKHKTPATPRERDDRGREQEGQIMAEEAHGVGESFGGVLRVALTIAAQFAERILRLREQLGWMREASALQQYRELESRFESERGAARASLAPVQQAAWRDTAGVDDIAQEHETSTVWCEHDEGARG